MGKTKAGLMVLLLGAMLSGCVLEGGSDTEPAPHLGPPGVPPDVEVVVIEPGRAAIGAAPEFMPVYDGDTSDERFVPHAPPDSLPLPDHEPEALWPNHEPRYDDNPCACPTQACLESWADRNLGCDVCAVLVCDGTVTHVCHFCDES